MTNQNPDKHSDQPIGENHEHDSAGIPQEGAETPFAAESSDAPPAQDGGAEDLGARLQELTALVDILKNERLLALAEAENANKRADKRVSENAKYAVSNVCKALLQVADNLGRALMAVTPEAREQSETLKNLAIGVELTEKELTMVLETQGVRRISSLDQAFDANLHNAVQEVENTAEPSGTVVQVLQEGYLIHDRLLRPAMVVVSRGGPKRESSQPSDASAADKSGVDRTA
jgi:molecular chaperone GrpE